MLLLTWSSESYEQVELPSLWTISIPKQQQQKRKVNLKSTTKVWSRLVGENNNF